MKRNVFWSVFLFCLLNTGASIEVFSQTTRYVRPSATGDGTGSSWSNASNDLQAMINASVSGDRIYVAAGTYVPIRSANNTGTITENNVNNAFVLKAGVEVYGGFDPDNGSTLLTNRTAMPGSGSASILSGDMDGDNSGNSRHVVIIAGGADTYTLDGFIIQRSNASNSSTTAGITVNGQTVRYNSGGGIYITNAIGGVSIKNCWIRGNRGNMGGGAYTDVPAIFTNCVFSGNFTTTNSSSNSRGGGLYNAGTGSWFGTMVINCTFSGNRASANDNGRGGAICNTGGLFIINSIIYGNTAANGQPGIRNEGDGGTTASYCLIGDNSNGVTAINSLSGNPQFVNAPGTGSEPFITGDYKLNSNSSVINEGDNGYASIAGDIDIAGYSRIQFGKVDAGAFESENGAKAGSIVYVKETGTGDGSSWANATNDLQAAINASTAQVWVAGGTYKPNRKANDVTTFTPNDRDNAFVLKNNVKIYGGFAGTETSLAQRNLGAGNTSVLSGDFNGNDVVSGSGGSLTISNNGENAYHVLIAVGVGSGTVLDGFTITGGNANGGDTSITVNGQSIGRYRAGGLSMAGATSPTVVNCIFTGNYGGQGGAVAHMGTGGVSIFTNCVFFKNRGSSYGGVCFAYSGVQLINCTAWGNRANIGGFADITGSSGTLTIRNSVAYGNSSGINNDGGTLSISHSLVQGQSSTANGNINGSTNPLFVNASGGDFRLQPTSPAINAGNNSLIPSGVTKDIEGNTRIQGCAVDMGAYESTPTAPVAEPSQTFCAGETVATLAATGNNLQWYNVSSGGTPLALETALVSGTSYYVSQTINGCESPRATVSVTAAPVYNHTISPAICPGQSYVFAGTEYTSSVSGVVHVFESIYGCDSTVTMNLTVNPTYNHTINPVICTGQSYNFGGTEYTESISGVQHTFTSVAGCDSTVTMNLTVFHARYVKAGGTGNGSSWANASGDLQAMINEACSGSNIFVAAGTYYPNRKANDLETITPNDRDNAFVLKNSVQLYGGFAGTEASLAQRDLSNPANKSILSGDFDGNDVVSGSGSSLAISNNSENAHHVVISANDAGDAVLDGFTITGGRYAEGTIQVNLSTVYRSYGGGIYITGSSPGIRNCIITGNDANTGGGVYVTTGSSPSFTNAVFAKNMAGSTNGGGLYNSGGSGSTTTITNCIFWGNAVSGANGGAISLLAPNSVALRNSIVYGNKSGINGSAVVSYSLVQGSSSTADGNINGSTNPLFRDAENGGFSLQPTSPAINAGSNSLIPAGITTDIVGNARITGGTVDMGAYEACTITNSINPVICTGQSYEFAGTVYTQSVSDIVHTFISGSGCDSIVTMSLTVTPPITNTIDPVICTGQSYEFGGTEYTESVSGVQHTFQTAEGCDSIITMNLTVTPPITSTINPVICIGQSYNFGGTEYTEPVSGIQHTFTTAEGCDSIVTMSLTVTPPITNTIDPVICGGQSYEFGGTQYTSSVSGVVHVFEAINGCDSTVTMNLTVNPTYNHTINPVICEGQSYEFGGTIYTSSVSGVVHIFETINGCDSIVTMNLTVNPTYNHTINPVICEGQSYMFAGAVYTENISGVQHTFTSVNGCDSTVTLNLTVAPTYNHTINPVIHTGQSYNFGGTVYTESVSNVVHVFESISGCDSTVTMNLEVIHIRYVKEGGTGDGTSWANASGDLQAMINTTSAGDTIFVAAGIYKPNRRANATGTITLNNRNNAFVLRNGVKIYGGFAGTEALLSERILDTDNPSILSGDFNNNDAVTGSGETLSITGNTENAYHVVVGSGNLNTAVLDGFTITGGNANSNSITITVNGNTIYGEDGGGIFLTTASSATIANCIFSRNSASYGAGMIVYNSSPLIDNVTFYHNRSGSGAGGMYLYSASPKISNATFRANRGNAITNSGSSTTITNSYITDNFTAGNGGAIYSFGSSSLSVTNSIIAGNTAEGYSSSGGIDNSGNSLTTVNCTFYNNTNTSTNSGGGISNYSGTTTVRNCIFWNNTGADNVGATNGIIRMGGTITAVYSLVQQEDGVYPGEGNINTDPLFTDAENGDFSLQSCSPVINKGNNSYITAAADIAGNTRVRRGTVDMGAYESPGYGLQTTANTALTASGYCEAPDGWIHFYHHDNEDKIFVSVHTHGQDLGEIHAATILQENYAHTAQSLSIPYGQTKNFYPFNRSWALESDNTFDNPVSVRFYFNATDSSDIAALLPFDALQQLTLYKVDGNDIRDRDATGYKEYLYGENPDTEYYTFGEYQGIRYAEFQVSSFSTGTMAMTMEEAVLPLDLLSFTASGIESRTYLQWHTVNEEHVSHFEIERSRDARNWQTIYTTAALNGIEQRYEAWDNQPLSGTNYYRLKMTDLDGTYKYSKIVEVTFGGSAGQPQFMIYPNPNNGIFTIRATGMEDQKVRIQLYDALGRLMYSDRIQEGNNLVSLENLVSGLYYLSIAVPGRTQVRKVVVE